MAKSIWTPPVHTDRNVSFFVTIHVIIYVHFTQCIWQEVVLLLLLLWDLQWIFKAQLTILCSSDFHPNVCSFLFFFKKVFYSNSLTLIFLAFCRGLGKHYLCKIKNMQIIKNTISLGSSDKSIKDHTHSAFIM